ncbi:MAG: hypothetical protein ABMA64_07545 [Myxococcota bacterium]
MKRLLWCGWLASAGCGDKCEQLCQGVGGELADCKPDALSWNDFGARNRADFVNQCQQQWNRERIELTVSDLRLSLEACAETSSELPDIDCAEILALYGPED